MRKVRGPARHWWPLLVIALVLSAGALAALPGAELEAPPETAAALPETQLMLKFSSVADRTRTLRVMETATGILVHEADLVVTRDAPFVVQVAVRPVPLVIEIGGEGVPGSLMDDAAPSRIDLDVRGCLGVFQVEVFIQQSHAGVMDGGVGCRTGVAGLDAMMARANAAAPLHPALPRTAVPAHGDELRYRATDALAPDGTDPADWSMFSALATNHTIVRDHRGASEPGVVFQHVAHEASESGLGQWRHETWFRAGSWTPAVVSTEAERVVPSLLTEAPDPILTSLDRVGADPWPSCFLRNALQGETTPVPASSAPFACSDANLSWRFEERDGHLTIYGIPDGTMTTSTEVDVLLVFTLDPHVPYPAHAERYRLVDGYHRHDSLLLDAYTSGSGTTIDTQPATPKAGPVPGLAPVDPLYGPSDDGVDGRLPVPLRQAVDAALTHPATGPLLTDRPDLVLAGASYRVQELNGFEQRHTHAWGLTFTDPAGVVTNVVCTFTPALIMPIVGPTGPTLAADCKAPQGAPAELSWIGHPPGLGPRDVPALGAAFAHAIRMWDTLRQGPGGPVDIVGYRAWDLDRPAHKRAALLVGTRDLGPNRDSEAPDLAQVVVALGDGALLAERRSSTTIVVPAQEADPYEPRPLLSAIEGTPRHVDVGPSVTIGATGLLAGALALRWVVPWLVARTRGQDPLAHPQRARLVALLAASAGMRRQELREEMQVGNAQLEHHLAVLVRSGDVREFRHGTQRFFFVGDVASPEDMQRCALLHDPTRRNLWALVRAHPGATIGELAEHGGVDVSQASRAVSILERADLVRRQRTGRHVRVWPNR